jgi:hypothetical protein
MSIQAAIHFIHQVRDQKQASELPVTNTLLDDLEEFVKRGAQVGYDFSADDLRAAFRHDWQMRWLRFSSTAQG